MSEVQTTAATVKLTAAQKLDNKLAVLFERINKDTEQYNVLLAERQELERLANIEAGFVVTFSVGKGEAAKVVEARVLGVSEGVAKVTYGEGFDTTVATIKLAQVLSVVADNSQPAAEAPVEQDSALPASTDEQGIVG